MKEDRKRREACWAIANALGPLDAQRVDIPALLRAMGLPVPDGSFPTVKAAVEAAIMLDLAYAWADLAPQAPQDGQR